MNSEKLDKLLDNLTSGLDSDLEVKLDVRNELQAHLEDKIAAGEESGLSEAESIEQTIKNFGDTIAVSDGLIEANFARMKFKARLYKTAMILIIPSVIFCAFISFASFFDKLVPNFFFSPLTMRLNSPANSENGWFGRKLSRDEKLILDGDKSRKTRHDQQKAIWERFPENKVFLANYILSLQNDNKISNNTMLEELQKAKEIDPENALYNYFATSIYLRKGSTIESKRISYKDKKTGSVKHKDEYFIKITDRKYMDLAVKEYLSGAKKKYYHSYAFEMMNRRLDVLGTPDSMTDNIRQISISASTLLPQLNVLRSISRGIWQYAGTLQKEGHQDIALKIANSWEKYVRQITDDSHCLIEMLVDAAVIEIALKNIPEIYNRAGKKEEAEQDAAKMKRVTEKMREWRESIKRNGIGKEELAKIGVLGALTLPALGGIKDYTEKEIAVSRKIEYAAFDNKAILVLNIVLFITMIAAIISSFYWRRLADRKALLLTPNIKFVGKLFLAGIVIPIALYFTVSQFENIGGHGYNIGYSFMNYAAQWLLLFVVIPVIIYSLIRKKTSQRCIDLEVETPEYKKTKISLIVKILFLAAFLFFALFPAKIFFTSWQTMAPYNVTAGVILATAFITATVHGIFCFIVSLYKGKKYALYYGAVSRMFIPLLGLAIIFITVAVKPYLVWREANLMKQDKIIYGHPKTFTPVEYKVTMKLKKMILDNLNNPEK